MKKTVFLASILLVSLIYVGVPNAAAMLGVNVKAAGAVVDAIMAGMSIWSIIGLVAVSGGTLAVAWYAIKEAANRFGRKVALGW